MALLKGGAGGDFDYTAGVNVDGQLLVKSESQSHDRELADQGFVWSLPFSKTPTGAGDHFFYIKNTGTVELHITDIRIRSASAETYTIQKVTGTPIGGTTLVPVNRNLGSSKIPTATIEEGVDITGLTTGGIIFHMTTDTANRIEHLRTTSNIHLPQGTACVITAGTGAVALVGMVSIVADPSSGG